ncbi:hypothetical protein [Pandoravirus japonicus]|uniref:Uncharacterized protein n=1 Tax=Pandoravirus japonicus TaxID=2823154 RepID=A0A811BN12_9VIRU|nr:hypothetical protein [Pandoravirus japonicus]
MDRSGRGRLGHRQELNPPTLSSESSIDRAQIVFRGKMRTQTRSAASFERNLLTIQKTASAGSIPFRGRIGRGPFSVGQATARPGH